MADVPLLTDKDGNPVEFDYSFDFQQHDWVQGPETHGHEIVCAGKCTIGHRHGHQIPVDTVLSGSRGQWKLLHYNDERETRRRVPPGQAQIKKAGFHN